jgi:hypothetical protein
MSYPEEYKNNIRNNEFVMYKDVDGGIYAGGIKVKSSLLEKGVSPIMSLKNKNKNIDDYDNIDVNENYSSLFDNLVVPNWATAYKNITNVNSQIHGGSNDITPAFEQDGGKYDDEVVDDDLYSKLLKLVEVDENGKEIDKVVDKKNLKKTRRVMKKKSNKKETKKGYMSK